MIEIVSVGRADEALLRRFYDGLYLAEFAAQREPLETWTWALWSGAAPYRMAVRIVRDVESPDAAADTILGGVAYELYPRSGCGLVTYMAVAPGARGRGLGQRLLGDATRALFADGARAVFGEVNDPHVARRDEPAEASWARLERNQRWGARVVDVRYVQPALGEGLDRDRALRLIALASASPLPAELSGALVREFVSELFEATERGKPVDAELRDVLDGIPELVQLVELRRGRRGW